MNVTILVLAWCGTFFDVLFLVPQLIKIIKSKSVNDISLFSTLFTLTAGILWIIYGVHSGQMFLYFANIFVSLFSLILLILQISWKKEPAYDKKEIKELMKLDIKEIDKKIAEINEEIK